MEVIDDKELVQRTLDGDCHSFDVLFERHRVGILAMLCSRSGDGQLSEDILQEAFIKAFLGLKKFNAEYEFGAWIMRIAQNLLIDYNRRVENRPQESAVPVDVVSNSPNPEESFMGVQNSQHISDTLQKLNPSYREMIELRFFKDMSYEEISNKLGLPMGTVKTQIHRARRAFIEILG